ncbi:DUF3180 domain-containing protein [Arthrobacter crusticola]|uniref:DUF3180 domain-containing protein n=1 Tax=Arthrobacter crusticola TaxID=2547960 RepID=A0A4V3AMK2_9MICC|nr:DUF3180 domain-containing protein [Arthrobacter crusticola]TDK24688.1 DUF3180 domain-containing protein [Arthrobacter crusticola]
MMSIRFSWLIGIGIVSGVVGWTVNFWAGRNGYPTPSLHLSSLLTVALIIAVTLVFGVRVLRWRNGKRDRELNPILAARTVVLAQATAYAGALSLGWHAGIFVDQLSLLAVRDTFGPAWGTLALMAGGIVMVVVGLVVEGFCRIPPEDEGGAGTPGTSEGEYA